ncbi:MAG TPA: hypothetical protein VID73_02945, partial [Ktedonobacterales bacterium]
MAPTPSTLAPRPIRQRPALDDRSLPPAAHDPSLMGWMAGTSAAWDDADDTGARATMRPRRTARPRTLMETVTATHMPVVAPPRPALERAPRAHGLPAVAAPAGARTLVIPAAPHAAARPATARTLPRFVACALLL